MTVIFGFRGIVSQMPIYHSLLVFSLFRRITMGSLSAEDSSVGHFDEEPGAGMASTVLNGHLTKPWRVRWRGQETTFDNGGAKQLGTEHILEGLTQSKTERYARDQESERNPPQFACPRRGLSISVGIFDAKHHLGISAAKTARAAASDPS